MSLDRDQEGRGRRITGGGGCALAAAVVLVLVGLAGLALYVYDLRWERKLDAKLAEFRAAGQPVTWEEVLAAREPIPDEENSALILLQAFTHLEGAEGAIAGLISGFGSEIRQGARHSDQMRAIIRSHLAANSEALKLIHEAAQFPRGAYPLDPSENPVAVVMDYLSEVRGPSRLCAVEAAFHAEARDPEQAARSLIAGRRAAASIGEGVNLIEVLVRMAAGAIWVAALERTLECCEMPPEGLHMLREEIALEEAELSLELAFCGERAQGYYYFSGPGRKEGDWASEEGVLWQLVGMVPGWREKDAVYYYGVMEQAVSLCSLPPYQRLEEAERLEADVHQELMAGWGKHMMSSMLMPAFGRAFQEEVKAHVRLQVAHTALAVEEWRLENGRWPESLEQLVPGILDTVPEDPFSDRPLYYVKADTGVMVYSVGADGADNLGLTAQEAEESAGYPVNEGWDIPFRLLNPELRGARTLTFREEIMASGLDMADLEEAGFTREKLEDLGFTPDDVRELGWGG